MGNVNGKLEHAETQYEGAKEGGSTMKLDNAGETHHTSENDSGFWLSPDRDLDVTSPQRRCFSCCEEGKTHPLEHFTCCPCCFYNICLDCRRKDLKFCGECLTAFPPDENALAWISEKMQSGQCRDRDRQKHLLGRVFVNGCHTYLDELLLQPLYQRQPPPCQMLAFLNPPNVQTGVDFLLSSAENGVVAAMLDLADTYNTSFHNDPFQKDKKQAEYWFRRALGMGNNKEDDGTAGTEQHGFDVDSTPVSADDLRNIQLKKRIGIFSRRESVDRDFVSTMHKIRELGNEAAHRSPDDPKLDQKECEAAVRAYRQRKEEYEIKKSTVQSAKSVQQLNGATNAQKTRRTNKRKGKKKKN